MNTAEASMGRSLFEVVELTESEMKQTDGGGLFIPILICVGVVIICLSSALGSASASIFP